MEVGKLATSPLQTSAGTAADQVAAAKGSIFYFILDEDYPDEPRDGHQRYLYVVSESGSYIEAYCFLCRSLCSSSTGTGPAKATTGGPSLLPSALGSIGSSAGTHHSDIDGNSTKLRQWYQLYVRVFGTLPYDTFLAQVSGAPRGKVARNGSGLDDPTALPVLFSEEASARAALANYWTALARQAREPRGGRAGGADVSSISARQPTSCTPEKYHTAAVGAAATPRPSTAPAPRYYDGGSGRDFAQHQQELTRRPAPPPPKLSHQADSVVDMQFGNLSVDEHAPTRRGNVTVLDPHPRHHQQQHSNKGGGVVSDAAAQMVLELRGRLDDVQDRAARETAALRQDVERLSETLFAERESRDGLLQDAVLRERSAARAHGDLRAKTEIASLKGRLRAAEEQAAALRSELAAGKGSSDKAAAELRSALALAEERLKRQRREHGDKLRSLVSENQAAVLALDKTVSEKEEELRGLYDEALQRRDIRIAQLSERLVKSEQAARQSTAEAAAHRRRCEELEARRPAVSGGTSPTPPVNAGLNVSTAHHTPVHPYHPQSGTVAAGWHWERERVLAEQGLALQRDLAAAREEATTLRHHLYAIQQQQQRSSSTALVSQQQQQQGEREAAAAVEALQRQYGQLESAYTHALQANKNSEAGLHRAEEVAVRQQSELASAAHLIAALRDGLELVKRELPSLREELLLPPPDVQ